MQVSIFLSGKAAQLNANTLLQALAISTLESLRTLRTGT